MSFIQLTMSVVSSRTTPPKQTLFNSSSIRKLLSTQTTAFNFPLHLVAVVDCIHKIFLLSPGNKKLFFNKTLHVTNASNTFY